MDNQFYKAIIMNSKIGYAYHKILCNDRGVPCDYEFIEVNPTFEAITGLKAKDIIGKRITQVIPNIKADAFDWIGTYGDIALNDGKKDFDQFSTALGKWYRVSAYSPVKNYFTTDFFDISKEAQQNEALKLLVQSSEQLLRMESGSIDYARVTEDCLLLSQAKIVYFCVVAADGVTEAVAAMAGEQAAKVQAVILHPIRRAKGLFSADRNRFEEKQTLVRLSSLRELADPDLPANIIASLEKTMGLGETVIILITTKNRVLGYFTLIMDASRPFERAEIVETFARQVGMTMSRVEAEDTLKDTQMLLRSSLESPQDMIILSIDRNYNYYFFNQAHKQAMKFAYDKDVAIGMNILDAITSDIDKVNAKRNYDRAMSGVSHSTIQSYGDVQVSTYESFYNPVWNDKNEIVGATAFARDITERIQAENALKDSEERFQLLFDQAPLGYQSLDSNGNFLNVNQQWLDLLGFQYNEVIGKWFGDFLSEEYREAFRTRFELFKQRGKIHSEFEMIHKNGTKLFIDFEGLVGLDQNRKFKQTHCILNDVTKRKQAEIALKESEEKYRLLYAAMSQGLALHEIITDEAGKPVDYVFLDINDSYTQLLGVTREASIGKRIREVMPQVEQYWIDIFGKVALTGEPTYYENFLVTTGRYYATYSYSPKPRQFAVLVSDITDRRKKEEEILYISNYDQLTGLPNRRHFESQLARLDIPENLPLTVCMTDINGLKLINDSFGHQAGDAHIKMVADITKKLLRPRDFVARIGGDEFVIILPLTSEMDMPPIVNKIKAAIMAAESNQLKISMAFGYETKTDSGQDILDIYQTAENHMYRHKLSETTSLRSKTIDLIMNTLFEKNPREMKHSERVSAIAVKIATYLGLDDAIIRDIRIAGLMHDIGKIGISESVLNKTGKLTREEYTEIKKHPEIGYRILSTSSEFSDIADCIYEHHEHWDGTGYPAGLKKEEISLPARIIGIADAYDAMTSMRTYRETKTKEQAYAEIAKCAGTQFDPEIAKSFLAHFTE